MTVHVRDELVLELGGRLPKFVATWNGPPDPTWAKAEVGKGHGVVLPPVFVPPEGGVPQPKAVEGLLRRPRTRRLRGNTRHPQHNGDTPAELKDSAASPLPAR